MYQHDSETTPQQPGRTVRGAHAARPLVYTSPSNNEIQPAMSQEECPTLERGGSALCCSLSRVDSGAVAAAAASQDVEAGGLRASRFAFAWALHTAGSARAHGG